MLADVTPGQDTHAASESSHPPTDMAPRASSPALSENEFDIFDALAGGDEAAQPMRVTADLGIDLEFGSDDGSDDEAFIAAKQAAANRKNANAPGKSGKKGGGFQAMGLNVALLKAIAQKGFKIPTPIQRKAVPLILQGDDVVGMARTGSGKTAAFVIPMIERLKTHSAKVGARGVIMSPSRELALQTLKVVKEFGRGTDLRTILLVGGDSLEERMYAYSGGRAKGSPTRRIQLYDYESGHHHRNTRSLPSLEGRNGARLVLGAIHRI
jgi:ATP-dependent RNA helicase DDX54/DBP10